MRRKVGSLFLVRYVYRFLIHAWFCDGEVSRYKVNIRSCAISNIDIAKQVLLTFRFVYIKLQSCKNALHRTPVDSTTETTALGQPKRHSADGFAKYIHVARENSRPRQP
jgi:hypothetical protein